MPPRLDGLFPGIASFAALHAAALKAVRGKRGKPGAAAFMANLERECLRLERQLNEGTWRPGRYVEIPIRDPKPRLVSAAPFRDRVVHHAVCAVLAAKGARLDFPLYSCPSHDGALPCQPSACSTASWS